jgi:hypothetical protein
LVKNNEQLRFFHLLRSPLEAGNAGILDFVEVLDTLGAVHENVRSGGVGTEAPDLPGFGDVVFVLVGQVTGANLEVVPWVDLALLAVK